MTKARLDDRTLSAQEALILCWFNTIAMNHVKIHSAANWGLDVENNQRDCDRFVARNSLVTVMYNYFGYTVFGKLFPTWTAMGLTDQDYSAELKKCFNIGIDSGVPSHSHIRVLVKHSTFVHFLINARSIFLSEFRKHKQQYFSPNIESEAMFLGTITHGLDHTMMERNLEDPLWLDAKHPDFDAMAQIGQIVKVGFVPDVPGLYFHKRFKGSGHPFYESVYKKCAKINEDLADNMNTCIIK